MTPHQPATNDAPPSRRARAAQAAGVAAWFTLILLIPVTASRDAAAPPIADWRVALGALPLAAFYTLMLLAAVRVTRRFAVSATVPRHLAIHAATALGFGVTTALIERIVAPWSPANAHFPLPVAAALNAAIYALLAGAAHGVEYARRYRRTEAAELRLRAELNEAAQRRAEAELRVLKAELNPHFLGNALHVVASLTRTDRATAERMLGQLDTLLQSAVVHARTQQVTLDAELAQLEPFLAIERARLGGALEVVVDVAPDTRAARVPHLLLQPLVENAVRHGLAPHGGGRITLSAHRGPNDTLEITVADDGVGLSTGDGARRSARGVGLGVGLANGRARLAELYGSAATLSLAPNEGGGTVARVALPWRVTDASPRSAALDDVHDAHGESDARNASAGSPADDSSVSARPARRLRAAHVALAVWFAALWLLWTGATRAVLLEDGRRITLPAATIEAFIVAVMWTVILLTAIRLTRRAPVVRPHAVRHLSRHLGAAVALAIMVAVSKLLVSTAFGYPLPAALAQRLVGGGVAMMSLYALFAAAAHGVEYAGRYRFTEAARLRLRDRVAESSRRRAEAELHALKTELNPQLLGSAVRTAASLVATDPDAAVRVLGLLGTMVRDALLRTRVQEVTLEEELTGLEPFLEVARTPVGSHAAVEWDVDPATLGARVPHLILQPLLAGATGAVRVVARRAGARLHVEVADDDATARPDRDAGVANARARLAELYGDDADLAFEAVRGGSGSVARLELPFVDDDSDETWSAR